ncbi:MAG TPA: YdcF family protein, partial [Patescibacteria group bacterium]|nr:YdcF family protein [Patescibacteria group bacterium]
FGIHLAQYKTYAQLGAATLIRLGLDSNAVQAVPAPRVPRDRTYAEAVALKRWLLEHDIKLQKINLVSVGLHSRRSRLLYQKAMGKDVVIGVTSIALKEYDPRHWWRYSAGVRSVIAESVAYLYARFLFSPPKEPPAQSAQ